MLSPSHLTRARARVILPEVTDVSVLLPYRNAAPTLRSALESVLRDRSVKLELLAIDNGSTDEGPALVEALARGDARVRPLRSESDAGLVGALELGRRMAHAPVLARMDADDLSLPGRLRSQLEALAGAPRMAAVGTQVSLFGAPTDGMERYVRWQNGLIDAHALRRALFVESPLCHPSVALRASALDTVGGYQHGDFPEDYELWLRLDAAGWSLGKIPEVLLHWRRWMGQSTFRDPRYRPEAFRALKARYLAPRLPDVPLVMWGAGVTGRRFARALEAHGRRVSMWIDIDPKKIGGHRRNAPVRPREELHRGLGFVLVAVGAAGARDEVRAWLNARGFREEADYLCVA